MRRVLIAIGLAVFALAIGSLAFAQGEDKKNCTPPCSTCTCLDNVATTDSEPDSTQAYIAWQPRQYGVAVGMGSAALTVGLKAWGDKPGAWLDNALERKNVGIARAGFELMSTRMMRDSLARTTPGFTMSAKAPSPKPTFRIVVMDRDKPVWSARRRPAGALAMVDQWPSLATAGLDRRGGATCGWVFSSARAIQVTRGGGLPDTTVQGDQIQISLEGGPRARPALLRLHASAEVDSIMVPTIRAGLFNRTAMK